MFNSIVQSRHQHTTLAEQCGLQTAPPVPPECKLLHMIDNSQLPTLTVTSCDWQ